VTGTYAVGISGANIVGYYIDGAGNYDGFLLNQGAYTTLEYPVGVDPTFATGVSGANIVGYYTDDAGNSHGFLYNGTTYASLDDPLGIGATAAYGISGASIVGYYVDTSGGDHGFLYQNGAYTTLDDPSGVGLTFATGVSGNIVVGYYIDSSGNTHGFRYNGVSYKTLDDPLGIGDTFANGVSGSDVVGYYVDADGNNDGFVFNGTTYGALNDPLGIGSTFLTGVSGANIVGYYVDGSGNTHGFLHNAAGYATLDDPLGMGNTFANGVSGNSIVGYYVDGNGNDDGFLATNSGPPPAINAGKYTVLISATDTDATIPQGIGYATMIVTAKGGVVIAGKLPDSESFTASGAVVTNANGNQFSINRSLSYPVVATRGAKGSLAGTVTFVAQTDTSDFSGTFEWVKPRQIRGAYPAAIDTNLNVIGSLYVPPAKKGSVLPGFTNGTLELSDTGALSLSGTEFLDKQVTLTSKNTLTVMDPGKDKLRIIITVASGVFRGTFLYPVPGKPPKLTGYYGVLFQDQTIGAGFFLGPDRSGTVSLTP
jgi:hypothetical protein